MFDFTLDATCGRARAGTLVLPHGVVRTPAFMPVGTHGVVRGLHPADVRRTGAQIILSNTYHLHLRPGEDVVRGMGGLHQFAGWSGPMLTDSGGFQVFSLEGLRKVTEEGVAFTSHLDGSLRTLTPERATAIQWALGADIAMAFDHVVPGQAPYELACQGMERTLRWLSRCREAHGEERALVQTLWPIIQGGSYDDLRLRSLDGILERGPWTGMAIGGLSVGEPKPVMYRVLDLLEPAMPPDVPRYLMGVGFPPDLLESIARGVDLFDCVAATRNGRHGTAWLPTGRVNVKGAGLKGSREPLDPSCDCETCTTFPRGYLRHLFMVEDMLALRLVSIHNIRFLIRLGEEARRRILDGTFEDWRREWLDRYHRGDP
jgi:queuine tRNA-ribosyltransferase